MDLVSGDYRLSNIAELNVVLGKNGCGKSSLLRELSLNRKDAGAMVKYITPERGGRLAFDPNLEANRRNGDWLENERRKNRFDQFRQSSFSEFGRLETIVLRKIEKDTETRSSDMTFDHVTEQINGLLENVEIVRSDDGAFKVRGRSDQDWREIDSLSSGESELISLAIEILAFVYTKDRAANAGKEAWLLFDEPDVHLHPDLQFKLMKLLTESIRGKGISTIIATHSTAIVSALNDLGSVNIAFMKRQQTSLQFESVSPALKAIIPVFGAHPLSNVFNDKPILLVEGEDDERIWQHACRSSENAIRLWPCVAGDIQSLDRYEKKAAEVIRAVYDNARAFSIRDRDEMPYEIDDTPPVVRVRLNCRAAENLLLSDDVLRKFETNWSSMKGSFEQWIVQHPEHKQHRSAKDFQATGWNRRDANVKDLRNIILTLFGTQKPWESVVGQSIAALKVGNAGRGEHSLVDYLGPKLVAAIGL